MKQQIKIHAYNTNTLSTINACHTWAP